VNYNDTKDRTVTMRWCLREISVETRDACAPFQFCLSHYQDFHARTTHAKTLLNRTPSVKSVILEVNNDLKKRVSPEICF